jgi:pSer/pThr/pTyr-binding forkhead associated (FHA) protein
VKTEPTSDAADLKARIEAERTGQAFIFWKDSDARQQILLLDPNAERVTIGRRGDQDIVLDWDKQVSRAHALLEKRGGDWTLIDELSQNGSYVNGDRINKRVRLQHKDVMCFGSTRITFQDRARAEEMDSTERAAEEKWAPMTARDRDVLRALCRPLVDDSSALPASNEEIAEEVALSVDAVKARLRVHYERHGLADRRQGEKRTRLARLLLSNGTFKPHDF